MYASVLLFALAGTDAIATGQESPPWYTSYSLAQFTASNQHKPLAVFFGSGKDGWQKLAKEGKLSPEVNEMLTSKYVCVYIDLATATGPKCSKNFGMDGGEGLVISDLTGSHMAWQHLGKVANEGLVMKLTTLSDPATVFKATESTSSRPRIQAGITLAGQTQQAAPMASPVCRS